MPEVLDLPPVATDVASVAPKMRFNPRLNPVNPQLREAAKAMYLQGKPLMEVAATLGLQLGTIKSWSFRERWKDTAARVKQVTQLATVKMSAIAMPAVQSEQSTRLRSMLASEVESQAMALASVPPRPSDLPNTPERQGRAAVLKTLVDAASVIHDWDSQHTPGIVLVGEVERMIEQSETPIDVAGSVEQIPEQADTTIGSVPEQ